MQNLELVKSFSLKKISILLLLSTNVRLIAKVLEAWFLDQMARILLKKWKKKTLDRKEQYILLTQFYASLLK